MTKEEINKAKDIVSNLFYDDKAITQWQWELLIGILSEAQEVVKNNIVLAAVSGSFDHDIIEKIRKSASDAEARRYLKSHIQNCH